MQKEKKEIEELLKQKIEVNELPLHGSFWEITPHEITKNGDWSNDYNGLIKTELLNKPISTLFSLRKNHNER